MKRTEARIATIIGKESVVDGDFQAVGSVRLDGTVEGNVKVSGHLVLGAAGRIHGNVEALSAMIGGEVSGNITASEKTELTSTARVIGDITTKLIVIDEKAIFQGKCDMNQEEGKQRKRPPREKRAGRKSAKDALREALKEAQEEAQEETKSAEEGMESVAAGAVAEDATTEA